MAEAIGVALATPGLALLILTFLAAGLVRGFAGFGTALIIMPVATGLVPPAEAVATMTLVDMVSWAAIMPRAWNEAARAEVGLLAAGALCAAPLGVALLAVLDPVPVRWVVAAAAGATLLALVSGWRFHGRVRGAGLAGIGGAAGLLGGLTGLGGPPVILFYLAGPGQAARIRANTILFLGLLDLGILANLVLRDMIGGRAPALALVLVGPYLAGLLAGQRLFTASRERFFRRSAYGIIALAILSGLPLFDR